MKQEKHTLPSYYHEEQNVTYSLIWFNPSRVILDFNPTARFKIRMADKQHPKGHNFVFDYLVEGNDFINRSPLAPTSPRIIDELLCNEFKRNK